MYRDGAENCIPSTAIHSVFREGLHDLIRRVVFDDPARSVPSPPECNWCDLTKLECRERIDSDLLLWHVRFRAGESLRVGYHQDQERGSISWGKWCA